MTTVLITPEGQLVPDWLAAGPFGCYRGRMRKSLGSRFWLPFTIWTLLVLASIAQSAIARAEAGLPLHWTGLVMGRVVDWYTCAIFTPVFIQLVRRRPLTADSWLQRMPLYLLVTSVCVVLKYALMFAILHWTAPAQGTPFSRVLVQSFVLESMIFWAVIAAVHAFELHGRLSQREQVAAELRAQLSQTELEMLKGQLQPHFLFNTLNGVASLIHTDPKTADFVVVQLADLLRASLEHEGARVISLTDELALVDKYLAIMEARFGGIVVIKREIAVETLPAYVPQFLLQPLVENAFEHGIGRRAGAGQITIRSSIPRENRLLLEVTDDGAGISADRENPHGVGLGVTRRRLQRLYGDEQSLTLSAPGGGGAVAAVELPLRYA